MDKKSKKIKRDFASKMNNIQNLDLKILEMKIESGFEALEIKEMLKEIERKKEKMGGMIIRQNALEERLMELRGNNGKE